MQSKKALRVHHFEAKCKKMEYTGCAEKMITTILTSIIKTSEAVEARTLLQSIGTLLSL